MRGAVDRTDGPDRTTRVGNPWVACAFSALALAGEAAVIVGLLRSDLMVVVAGSVLTVVTVLTAVRHPDLLLRTVVSESGDPRDRPAGSVDSGPMRAGRPGGEPA